MEAILEFKDVTFAYTKNGGKKVKILDNQNYSFYEGKMYAVIGESGSGKTTTLALAGALDIPQSGTITFMGKDIKKIGYNNYRRNDVSLIFQDYNLIKYMTALENVLLSMNIAKTKVNNPKVYAKDILQELGLSEDEINRNVLKLSGGQQQRVAIARALASNAKVLLADEPTGNLDERTSRDIINVFLKVAHEYNKCVIVVTHSQKLASFADEVYEIRR
ncbi:MAG: ABC transporter ATP-binding protein [Clostridiales bacterium]|jgi:putative ABC transport system ATP-binding protein|nr:ABC transporter ATP-binding protein [Clostridiales bacterium]